MAKATRVAARQAKQIDELAQSVSELASDLRRIERKLDALTKALKEGAD